MSINKYKLLDKYPEYEQGKLSQEEVNLYTRLLQEDSEFLAEVKRERLLREVLNNLEPQAIPRGLIRRSIRSAVGEMPSKNWINLDSIFLALGISLICGMLAQFFQIQLVDYAFSSNFIFEFGSLFSGASLLTLVSGVCLTMMVVLFSGAIYSLKIK